MRLSFIYVIGPKAGGVVKVGVAQDVASRRSSLQIGHWEDLDILGTVTVPMSVAKVVEAKAHARLGAHSVRGEWFRVTPERALSVILHAAQEAVAAKGIKNRLDLCNHLSLTERPKLAVEALSAYRDAARLGSTEGINGRLLNAVGPEAYGVFLQLVSDKTSYRDPERLVSDMLSDVRVMDRIEAGVVKALNLLVDERHGPADALSDLLEAAG